MLIFLVQNPKKPANLLAVAVGVKQKQNVDKIVKKVQQQPSFSHCLYHLGCTVHMLINSLICSFSQVSDFVLMLFHYDGIVDEWRDFDWSSDAIHIAAINQTKW